MKCKGCKWQVIGVDLAEQKVKYCIGSPDHEPRNGAEKMITSERIIPTASYPIYRANDDDECHYWISERFEGK